MRPISVLIMDDNELLAEALHKAFERDERFTWAGWAPARPQLMALLESTPVDLLLMDVDIPATDTFAIVQEVARDYPWIKVVMFSGHVRREYAEAAVDAGAYGYLSKDEDLSTICEYLLQASAGAPVLSPVVQRVLGSTC